MGAVHMRRPGEAAARFTVSDGIRESLAWLHSHHLHPLALPWSPTRSATPGVSLQRCAT